MTDNNPQYNNLLADMKLLTHFIKENHICRQFFNKMNKNINSFIEWKEMIIQSFFLYENQLDYFKKVFKINDDILANPNLIYSKTLFNNWDSKPYTLKKNQMNETLEWHSTYINYLGMKSILYKMKNHE